MAKATKKAAANNAACSKPEPTERASERHRDGTWPKPRMKRVGNTYSLSVLATEGLEEVLGVDSRKGKCQPLHLISPSVIRVAGGWAKGVNRYDSPTLSTLYCRPCSG